MNRDLRRDLRQDDRWGTDHGGFLCKPSYTLNVLSTVTPLLVPKIILYWPDGGLARSIVILMVVSADRAYVPAERSGMMNDRLLSASVTYRLTVGRTPWQVDNRYYGSRLKKLRDYQAARFAALWLSNQTRLPHWTVPTMSPNAARRPSN